MTADDPLEIGTLGASRYGEAFRDRTLRSPPARLRQPNPIATFRG